MSIKEFEHICGIINCGNYNENSTNNTCINNAWFRIRFKAGRFHKSFKNT